MRSYVTCICLSLLLSSSLSSAAPSLSPYIANKLVKARSLMETESWEEAKAFLTKLSEETKSDYANALIAQSLGQVAIYQDNLLLALNQFQKAYAYEALGKDNRTQLLHSIAQLHCGVDEWVPCRLKMKRWVEQAPDKVKASDYIVIAQAYSATEEWKEVVGPAEKAMRLKEDAPLNWYQLIMVAHSNLENWERAIEWQNELLNRYPEPAQEWRRLVALHLQREDYSSALSSMRVPFEKGLLNTSSDYKQMSQLLFHGGMPFKAGETLSDGIEAQIVSPDLDNLKLLVSLWIQSKEYDNAIKTCHRLLEISPERKWFKQLAMLYFQKKEWRAASKVLKVAVKQEPETDLQIMLGISLINLDEYDAAKKMLEPLQGDESVGDRVNNWLTYIKKVNV